MIMKWRSARFFHFFLQLATPINCIGTEIYQQIIKNDLY